MALTRQTMTDEQRKSVVLDYLKAFDNAGVIPTGGSIPDLFADDAQVYFPKWGLATGKEQISKLFTDVGSTIKHIEHHYAHFNWVFSGGDIVVCEGTSHGEHQDGAWRAGVPEWGPAGGATCSRSVTGRSSESSSISIPTTQLGTPNATPGWRTAPEPATEQRSSLRPVKTSQQRSALPVTGRGTIFIRAQGRGDTSAPPPGPPGTESAGWRTLQDS